MAQDNKQKKKRSLVVIDYTNHRSQNPDEKAVLHYILYAIWVCKKKKLYESSFHGITVQAILKGQPPILHTIMC